MAFFKNRALNLTETEIRYAMEHTRSNAEASRFVGCHLTTFRRYAKRYIDDETGLSLWELHKNQPGKGIHRNFKPGLGFQKADIYDILDGKYPKYDKKKLARRLLEEMIFEEKCSTCGFDERRITDYQVPLVLTWEDGDLFNHKRDNLKFICYNCYFLSYDDVFYKTDKLRFR